MEGRLSPSNSQKVSRITREAESIPEFLENPSVYLPRPEYCNGSFTIDDDTVLTHCIKIQNVGAVEALLRCGADPNLANKKSVAPISGASHKGNIAIMKMLLDSGASVNVPNSTGSTALIQAAHFGHLEAVKLLLLHNAASDFANQKGTTALMRASQEGHVEITKCLISSKVDVNRKNHEGMNALMLASQRGHANIVYILVKAGAVMDEQTAQGSTALMLACKRGHEKCGEVLVSMGAEIYIRDRRMRTARDTAQRRNHINMLCWLDTQVQVRRVQDGRHRQRAEFLNELRCANLNNTLRINPLLTNISDLYNTIKRLIYTTNNDNNNSEDKNFINIYNRNSTGIVIDEKILIEFTSTSIYQSITILKTPQDTIAQIQLQIQLENTQNEEILKLPTYRTSGRLALRHNGYADWHWPFLLQRCMGLPSGLYEQIMEYLPLPRVWQWSLVRLKRRCKLAPYQAVQDLSIIMDEILCDSAIFSGTDQKNLLLKLQRSPQMHPYLIQHLGMTEALLDLLNQYAHTQGLLLSSTEGDVVFKPQYARNMLTATVELYRWYRNRANAMKMLSVKPYSSTSNSTNNTVHGEGGTCEEEGDTMETTDVAGEEDGQEELEDEASDFEGALLAADPDSETDMVVDDPNTHILADSDSDNDAAATAGGGGGTAAATSAVYSFLANNHNHPLAYTNTNHASNSTAASSTAATDNLFGLHF